MLATVSSVVAGRVDSYGSGKIHGYVNLVLRVVMALDFGGFQANIVQFGLDQLRDDSSNEISFGMYGLAAVVTMWLRILLYWIIYQSSTSHWKSDGVCLSVSEHSLKLNANVRPLAGERACDTNSVVRCAFEYKHPDCRSAFTYCEDEPSSRIDFGKSIWRTIHTRAGGRCKNSSTIYHHHA